jgi:hypothetical protein
MITDEQAQAYLARRGEGCPVCGETALEGDSYGWVDGTIYQSITCTACGENWVDVYELDRILE